MTLPMRDEVSSEYIVVNAVEQQPTASKHFDVKDIDLGIVKSIEEALGDKLNILDNWILSPNGDALESLKEIASTIAPFYEKQSLVLLRGFGNDPERQETMGLPFEGMFWRKSLKTRIGDAFSFKNERPVSTTTDIDIAGGFGNNLVRTEEEIEMFKDNLPITPELCYIISRARNLRVIETQKEVILFPAERKYQLLQKTNR